MVKIKTFLIVSLVFNVILITYILIDNIGNNYDNNVYDRDVKIIASGDIWTNDAENIANGIIGKIMTSDNIEWLLIRVKVIFETIEDYEEIIEINGLLRGVTYNIDASRNLLNRFARTFYIFESLTFELVEGKKQQN